MLQDVDAPMTCFPGGDPAPDDWVFASEDDRAALAPWAPGMAVRLPLVRLGGRTLFAGEPGRPLESAQRLRAIPDAALRFAAFTALHLDRWLREHRVCGRCGAPLAPGRSLRCGACGLEVFPAIAPAVILGVTRRGKLLVTRYADRPYAGPALVAGYCEPGETLEATCRREALEEVGLRLGPPRYFASQPWGLSGALLAGFFAEAESDRVVLADGELAEARWLAPDELPPPPDAAGPLSLTATMIQAFALQRILP